MKHINSNEARLYDGNGVKWEEYMDRYLKLSTQQIAAVKSGICKAMRVSNISSMDVIDLLFHVNIGHSDYMTEQEDTLIYWLITGINHQQRKV